MGTSPRWRSEMWNKRSIVILGVTVSLLLVAGVAGAAARLRLWAPTKS